MSGQVRNIVNKFSFRKWRLGLLVAILTGLCTGLGALLVGVTQHQATMIILGSIAKDLLLFLKNHPIEELEDTVEIHKKDL